MKAVLYEQYGGPEVLQIKEVPTPDISNKEILVRVFASSATTADWRIRSLNLPKGFKILGRLIFGLRKPKNQILGTELSGVVVAVGDDVKKFKVGDEVIANRGAQMGCYVEYCKLHEDQVIVIKPKKMNFDEAAVLGFGSATAWDFLNHKSQIKKGESILINGASGSVGSAAVQIAKYLGAEVTAVCSSKNFEFVQNLGAKYVLDYSQIDITKTTKRYDKILDVTGNLNYTNVKNILSRTGQLLLVSGDFGQLVSSIFINLFTRHKVVAGPIKESAETLNQILNLVDLGHYVSVVDRRFMIDEIRDAHKYIEQRHRRGNVAIVINKQGENRL